MPAERLARLLELALWARFGLAAASGVGGAALGGLAWAA